MYHEKKRRHDEGKREYHRKRKRSRSRSPPRSGKRKDKRPPSPKNKKIEDYKHELTRFLEEQAAVEKLEDFWTFYAKYQALQTLKKTPETDRNKALNINFIETETALYEKLPVLDKHGERLRISPEDFRAFLLSVKVYQDFQQKTSFSKLKKIKTTQNDLPIARHKKEIVDRLRECRVMLIAGDTGCGKSTQVPQYVLEAGYDRIVCTQPRRIACVSLAKRVASETLTDYKDTVGYQIRFEKTKRAGTKIIFMTEGLLLRQAAEQETLNSYDVIILDEVHERHLHGDFLIGIMKCLLHKRDDFKLILMSATINVQLFKEYFSEENIQVIEVPGRLYPIDIQYKPIIKDPYERKRDRFDCTPYLQILQMIDEKYPSHQKGDMLVFLNGFSEISALAEAVAEYGQHKGNWIVLPLHSSLSLEEQDKVFDYPPEGVRKCIISTNIAETSVTIDGIRFVIDSGKVNRMTYNTQMGVNKLSETNISQDSAKQRAGRAGRTGPGVCFRMYSEEDFKNFEAYTPAEIHLVPLDSLLLHMVSLGLSDVANFPFLEKPAAKTLEEGMEKLKFVGALELDRECLALTSLGDALSQLPVDLSIGKMLVMSTVFGNVHSVLALASLLSVQSPLTQQAQRDSRAAELRRPLESDHGDPLTLLNLFKEWLAVKRSGENTRTWARKRCLEEQRFYEAVKLSEQFRDILAEAGLLPKLEEAGMSGGERAIRHGELKRLKAMRFELRNKSRAGDRKRLKYKVYGAGGEEEEEPGKADIRDVEFRISNDSKRLQRLLDEASADTHTTLTMLKLILTSGLYPQVAVADEHNSSKTVSEKLYHTKAKSYVSLRPTGYFAVNPDRLELRDEDVEVPPPGYFSRRPVSRRHQLLVYQSVLETKKACLVNAMRMPALQTLVLFAKTVATDATLTKFVFDDFLMVDVPYFGQGKSLLLRAVSLRKKWKTKLEAKLRDPSGKSEIDKRETFVFMQELVDFMNTEPSYNIRRLLPADLKEIYRFEPSDTEPNYGDGNPFDQDYSMTTNRQLGGTNVTENVVYDCLLQEDWAQAIEDEVTGTPFECPHCRKSEIAGSVLRILQHESRCAVRVKEEDVEGASGGKVPVKANSKAYKCPICQKELFLTPVDILRHKKGCK